MKKAKTVFKKIAIGIICVSLGSLAILGIYKNAKAISLWIFNSNSILFELTFKLMGIVWCLAFLRIGYDWIALNKSPFTKKVLL